MPPFASVSNVPSGSVLVNTLVQDWIDSVEAVATFTEDGTLADCAKDTKWYYTTGIVDGLQMWELVDSLTTFEDARLGVSDSVYLVPNFTFSIQIYAGFLNSDTSTVGSVTDGINTSVDGYLTKSVDSYLSQSAYTDEALDRAFNKVTSDLVFTLDGAIQESEFYCQYLKYEGIISRQVGTLNNDLLILSRHSSEISIGAYWYVDGSYNITLEYDPEGIYYPGFSSSFRILPTDNLYDILRHGVSFMSPIGLYAFDNDYIGETAVVDETIVSADTTVTRVYVEGSGLSFLEQADVTITQYGSSVYYPQVHYVESIEGALLTKLSSFVATKEGSEFTRWVYADTLLEVLATDVAVSSVVYKVIPEFTVI